MCLAGEEELQDCCIPSSSSSTAGDDGWVGEATVRSWSLEDSVVEVVVPREKTVPDAEVFIFAVIAE